MAVDVLDVRFLGLLKPLERCPRHRLVDGKRQRQRTNGKDPSWPPLASNSRDCLLFHSAAFLR